GYRLQGTGYSSDLLSPVPCSLSPVPCPLSPVPCPLSPVPCSLFPVPCPLFPCQILTLLLVGLVQEITQLAQAQAHPGFDRAKRLVQPLSDLGAGQAAVIGQLDRLALVGRQRA